TYRIAVRATNGEGFSTTAFSDVVISYKQPQVVLTGSTHSTTVGTTISIDFYAIWQSPIDRALGWIIDWGDGTERLGSTAANATHTYLTTGAAVITATVIDAENATGTKSNGWTLDVGVPTVDPGGPYDINEGDSLTVSGTAIGTPIGYGWSIGTGS